MNYQINDIKVHIGKLTIMLGHTMTATENHAISTFLMDELPLHKTIDFNEFKYLTELGVKHELGDVVHLSFSTICKMIKDYKASEFKKKYDKSKFVQRDELPELTESAKDEIFKNSIIATLTSDNLNVVSLPIIYDYLVKKGYVDAKDGAIKYLTQAKEITKTDLFKKKNDFSNKNDKDLNKEISKQILDLVNDEYVMDDVRFNAKILFMQGIDLNELENKLKIGV